MEEEAESHNNFNCVSIIPSSVPNLFYTKDSSVLKSHTLLPRFQYVIDARAFRISSLQCFCQGDCYHVLSNYLRDEPLNYVLEELRNIVTFIRKALLSYGDQILVVDTTHNHMYFDTIVDVITDNVKKHNNTLAKLLQQHMAVSPPLVKI